MDNTQVEIFIDNGAIPSILRVSIYNKYPILQKYPRTESHTPIHTGGGMIKSHFWIKIPLCHGLKISIFYFFIFFSNISNEPDIFHGFTH